MGNVSKYGGNNLDGYKDAIQTADRNKTGAALVGVTAVAALAIKALVTLAK
mgnify:CR=1 FL=1